MQNSLTFPLLKKIWLLPDRGNPVINKDNYIYNKQMENND